MLGGKGRWASAGLCADELAAAEKAPCAAAAVSVGSPQAAIFPLAHSTNRCWKAPAAESSKALAGSKRPSAGQAPAGPGDSKRVVKSVERNLLRSVPSNWLYNRPES